MLVRPQSDPSDHSVAVLIPPWEASQLHCMTAPSVTCWLFCRTAVQPIRSLRGSGNSTPGGYSTTPYDCPLSHLSATLLDQSPTHQITLRQWEFHPGRLLDYTQRLPPQSPVGYCARLQSDPSDHSMAVRIPP
jgi:hypothetical protein